MSTLLMTPSEYEIWSATALSGPAASQVEAFLGAASEMVREAAEGKLDESTHADVDDNIKSVIYIVVTRARKTIPGIDSERVGDYSRNTSGGLWLTDDEKARIRRSVGINDAFIGTITLQGYLPGSRT